MSDEARELLRRGAETSDPVWGFESVWERSRRHRRNNFVLKGSAIVASLSLIAVAAASISGTDGVMKDERPLQAAGAGTWEAIPPAPIEGRVDAAAVWTGEKMLVWGGRVVDPDNPKETQTALDGAMFDLQSRSWTEMSKGPLQVSDGRTAVWTGSEMVVWGGENGDGSHHQRPDNGAAFNPASDTWRELSPSPYWSLASHSVVWTGDEMIVWGGVDMEGRGAAYDTSSDSWTAISDAPVEGRFRHAAVWTGREMIVWGGSDTSGKALNDGAAYDPNTDSWRPVSASPLSKRDTPAAVWTGEEMIVWGGSDLEAAERPLEDGAAYNPETDEWRAIRDAPVRSVFFGSPTAWSGEQMVVTGDTGRMAVYSPSEDEWKLLSDPPEGRRWAVPTSGPALLPTQEGLLLWGGATRTEVKEMRLLNEGSILRLPR